MRTVYPKTIIPKKSLERNFWTIHNLMSPARDFGSDTKMKLERKTDDEDPVQIFYV